MELQRHFNGTKKLSHYFVFCVANVDYLFGVFCNIIIKFKNVDKDGVSGNLDKVYCVCQFF